jgi:hypothetical protein
LAYFLPILKNNQARFNRPPESGYPRATVYQAKHGITHPTGSKSNLLTLYTATLSDINTVKHYAFITQDGYQTARSQAIPSENQLRHRP